MILMTENIFLQPRDFETCKNNSFDVCTPFFISSQAHSLIYFITFMLFLDTYQRSILSTSTHVQIRQWDGNNRAAKNIFTPSGDLAMMLSISLHFAEMTLREKGFGDKKYEKNYTRRKISVLKGGKKRELWWSEYYKVKNGGDI